MFTKNLRQMKSVCFITNSFYENFKSSPIFTLRHKQLSQFQQFSQKITKQSLYSSSMFIFIFKEETTTVTFVFDLILMILLWGQIDVHRLERPNCSFSSYTKFLDVELSCFNIYIVTVHKLLFVQKLLSLI